MTIEDHDVQQDHSVMLDMFFVLTGRWLLLGLLPNDVAQEGMANQVDQCLTSCLKVFFPSKDDSYLKIWDI